MNGPVLSITGGNLLKILAPVKPSGMFVLKIFLKPGRSKRVSALLIHTALRADGQGVRGVSRLSCGHFRRQNFRAGHFNFNHLLLMRNLHERHS